MSGTNLITLLPPNLLTKSGYMSTVNVLANKQRVAILFGSNWCSACQNFTPTLVNFYSNITQMYGNNIPIEIIYVSLDKSKQEFDSYYAKMPWTAIPFEQSKQVLNLFGQNFDGSIPQMMIMDVQTSQFIDTDGQNKVHQLKINQQLNDPQSINNLLNFWLK
jgi:thiol-disulfide isomerase/thioredoxin